MNLTMKTIQPELINLLSTVQARHYRVIPFDTQENKVHFYIASSDEWSIMRDEIELLLGKDVLFQETDPDTVEQLLHLYYPSNKNDSRQQETYYSGNADNFLDHLIQEAKNLHSSDIHIEVFEGTCRVRIRIDGMLLQRYLIEKKLYPSLINKIKIISNLDIAEKRLPQDGRILYLYGNQKFDIRVSILPTLHGEKVVLRILNNSATNVDISHLGFSEFDLINYSEGIKKPNGILLISGPTGSGKTTTLYATLKLLNRKTHNILTIEDPIEYTLEGINQVQLKENIGLTFSAALRTFLRQDPDIIMLGEIRDGETANMAIRAALTGHLVLSTIHTNSAWGIVSRLIDMGVAPYLLANTLNTAVAQRLIRLLCPSCKKLENFTPRLYPSRFKPTILLESHYVAKGCSACFNTGYKGRKAIYEVVPIDEDFIEKIKSADHRVEELYQHKGIKTLSENAFALFREGLTSLDEIYPLLMT